MKQCPIGVFDSGFGGLTILTEIRDLMPQYDYLYLGDNARAPYGSHSFEIVYEYTLQAVEYLFSQGCELVILACNTASAKALRNIQQKVLPVKYPNKRVLGVIRPSTEDIDQFTKTNNVGVLATEGTVKSESYVLEVHKFHPEVNVFQHACPLWVPIIENGKFDTAAGREIIREDVQLLLQQCADIDAIILACTHYPIVKHIIAEFVSPNIRLIAQGGFVAEKLLDYLERHPEIREQLSTGNTLDVMTTDDSSLFDEKAELMFQRKFHSRTINLEG